MKITRLRKGYRIVLSDAEFDALGMLISEGCGLIENVDYGTLEVRPAVKRALKGRWSDIDALRVDRDNR